MMGDSDSDGNGNCDSDGDVEVKVEDEFGVYHFVINEVTEKHGSRSL